MGTRNVSLTSMRRIDHSLGRGSRRRALDQKNPVKVITTVVSQIHIPVARIHAEPPNIREMRPVTIKMSPR